MKTLLAFALLTVCCWSVPASARQNVASPAVAAPVVDSFEDGAQRLRIVGLASTDGSSMDVTLVYEDADEQTMRTVTFDADRPAAGPSSPLKSFLADMDPAFVSYVKATLADRFLHRTSASSSLDRAEATMFFPGAVHAGSVSRGANRETVGRE